MTNKYTNRGRLLARDNKKMQYPLHQRYTQLYTPKELPMPKPVRESALSGLVLCRLLTTELEIVIDFRRW